jgi:hypothetical protein
VVKGEFKEISLDDYKGKYVVLFFYPLDFTFVCPTEIIAFSDRFGINYFPGDDAFFEAVQIRGTKVVPDTCLA